MDTIPTGYSSQKNELVARVREARENVEDDGDDLLEAGIKLKRARRQKGTAVEERATDMVLSAPLCSNLTL